MQVFEGCGREFVAVERGGLKFFQPIAFDVGEDGIRISFKPMIDIHGRSFVGAPEENAGAVAGEEIHGLMVFVDAPDQRSVEPLSSCGARCHNSAWNEAGDVRVIAEVK